MGHHTMFAVLLLSLVQAIAAADSPEYIGCGAVEPIRGISKGIINYPNGQGGRYPKNQNCTWKIILAEGERMTLEFERFSLGYAGRHTKDILVIKNGEHGTSIGSFDGNPKGPLGGKIPPIIESDANEIFLHFTSDVKYNRFGFKVKWTKITTNCPIDYGCPESKGFFRPTGSQQCFKLITGSYSWDQADTECKNAGLVLAHPYETIGLRSYVITRFGHRSWAWLGARGDGTAMTWIDNSQQILSINPLWLAGQNTAIDSDQCLLLLSYTKDWNENPTKPYWGLPCHNGAYALCELNLEDKIVNLSNGNSNLNTKLDSMMNFMVTVNSSQAAVNSYLKNELQVNLEDKIVNLSNENSDLNTKLDSMMNFMVTVNSSQAAVNSYLKNELQGCPETEGFFRPTGSQQCFKFFPGNYKWEEGKDMCNKLGLVLAHPFDAVGLRSYMTQRFGDKNCGSYNCVTWIAARGDGTQYAWESNSRKISLDNPLWYPGVPTVYLSSKYCLLLLARASNWGPEPNRPYGADWCGVRNPVLCELVLS